MMHVLKQFFDTCLWSKICYLFCNVDCVFWSKL